jgi:hypothetical protein
LCGHLEAVSFGDITRLSIKEDGKIKTSNDKTGWKLASSVGGVGTGERADRVLADDLHNVKEAESDVVRAETVRWFRESMQNRLNDMENSAIVLLGQRVHEEDCSGAILSAEMDYDHLMITMEFDPGRHCETVIGWEDPREVDGELAWPARFPAPVVKGLARDLGPFAYASQYQQSPMPKGGNIFQRDWWQLWAPKDGKSFPMCNHVIASLDSAFAAKEENDPSALTVWGVFMHPEFGQRRIILLHAWMKFLPFSADRELIKWKQSEFDQVATPLPEGSGSLGYALWAQRTQQHWGLLEHVQHSARRHKIDKLLIEAKASGISAAQEIRNRYGRQNFR